jgi:hypothetical protein
MNGRHILDCLAILKTGKKPTPCNNLPTPTQNVVREFSNSSKIQVQKGKYVDVNTQKYLNQVIYSQ